jgi:hypothetical protein
MAPYLRAAVFTAAEGGRFLPEEASETVFDARMLFLEAPEDIAAPWQQRRRSVDPNDATLKAVVLCRTNVNEGNGTIRQKRFRLLADPPECNDATRTVNDTLCHVVPAHDVGLALQDLWKAIRQGCARTLRRMQEYWTRLGVGLNGLERPIADDQIALALLNEFQAMAARNAVTIRGVEFRGTAIIVEIASLQRADSRGWESGKSDRHRFRLQVILDHMRVHIQDTAIHPILAIFSGQWLRLLNAD